MLFVSAIIRELVFGLLIALVMLNKYEGIPSVNYVYYKKTNIIIHLLKCGDEA